MALAAQDSEKLAGAIARFVPEELLADVIDAQAVLADFKALRMTADDPARGRLFALARAAIDAYDAQGLTFRLFDALFRRMDWSPEFRSVIAPFAVPPDATADAREALLRQREHFIASPNLLRLTREIEPRVCCILGAFVLGGVPSMAKGTGFLVGPDLVLTAMHVVEPLVRANRAAEAPDAYAVYFDYVDGPALNSPADRPPGARRVGLAQDWLVAQNPSLEDDGLDASATAARLDALAMHLDFALLRLAEPVGLESRDPAGGPRRGWITIPDARIRLDLDRYVAIPQHPQGLPRSIDFGRFLDACPSPTRFKYTTETDQGSSGAPCLSREFELVGLHNAAWRPNGVPEANQAVDIAVIRPLIADALAAAPPPPPPALLWNVAPRADAPRVILGRGVFLRWLERAAAEDAPRRADRLYAADAPAHGSGKTFSTEILRRWLASRPEQSLVVFGDDLQLLPERVEDMARALADRLGVPAAALADMPVRPSAALPSESDDGDKLRRWASETTPRWFAGLLEKHRLQRVDLRAQALRQLDEAARRGAPEDPALRAQADSPEPIWEQNGWRVAWIALDRLPETRMSPEIRDFIAGLVGAADDEPSAPAALRRLRWLFLGWRPDFIAQGEITVETLDPTRVDAEDAVAPVRGAWAARGAVASQPELDRFKTFYEATAAGFATLAIAPEKRLGALQIVVNELIRQFLPPMGRA